jgi:hypothetical protein
MNVKDLGKKIVNTTSDITLKAGAQVDGIAESVSEFARKKINSSAKENLVKNSGRISNAIGTGVEGMAIGAGSGMVVGGISGAISDDESVIGGAAKGAAGGALFGLAGGVASGAIHNSPGLFTNAIGDYEAVAGKISKWKTKMGDGISDSLNSAML